jgi:hypothetical protein
MTITCASCGSPDWWRCDPGDVPVTDGEDEAQDCAAVAWCIACDPCVRRAA